MKRNLYHSSDSAIYFDPSGIGAAAALLFASKGAKVVVSDRNEQSCRKITQEIIDAGGEVCTVVVDVAKA